MPTTLFICFLYLKYNTGGKADIVDSKGKTPLHRACMAGQLQVVILLVEKHDADINLADADVRLYVVIGTCSLYSYPN